MRLLLETETTGATAESLLRFRLESDWDVPVKVDVIAIGHLEDRDVVRLLDSRELRPEQDEFLDIDVSELPVQVVEHTTPIEFVASHVGPDGVERHLPLDALYVQHEPGFARARVRDAAREAEYNAARPLAALYRKDGVVTARVFEPSRAAAAGEALAAGEMVALGTNARPTSTRLVGETPDLLTADEIDAEPSEAELKAPLTKAGTVTACFKVQYQYRDSSMGEDRLLNGSTPVDQNAALMKYQLHDPSGASTSGTLNAFGCMAPRTMPNGTYMISLTPTMVLNGKTINVFKTSQNRPVQFVNLFNVAQTGGTVNVILRGVNQYTNAAVAVTSGLLHRESAFRPMTVDVFADETCPGIAGSGCAIGFSIFLGTSLSTGLSWAGMKFAVIHELGHIVQKVLFGSLKAEYDGDVAPELCRCDHVEVNLSSHCLQSSERIWAAQTEGFGHAFAVDVLNYGTESNCTLVYYKHFRNPEMTITVPPVAKTCFSPVRWLNTHCNANSIGINQGTEWDWMRFYWQLLNKGNGNAYTYDQLRRVYRRACGNADCNSTAVTWNALQAAAKAEFGTGSAKANWFLLAGSDSGVIH